jgi:nitroreductase
MADQSAYQKRFGGAVEDTKYPPNDFIERVLSRATVRRFRDQPLADGQLELLIAAAQSAATSGMLQTWSVIALTDKAHKDLLIATPAAKITMGSVDSSNMLALDECAVFLIWLADLNRVDNILKAKAEQYNIDPEIIAQCSKAEYHLKAIIDATIAAQTFSLAAESQGLAVMYCGAVRQISIEHLAKSFNLPPLTFPIFGMAIGYPMVDWFKPVKPRLPTDVVLHYNSYKPFEDLNKLEEYNQIHKKYNGSNKLINKDYVERLIERMAVTDDKKAVGPSLRQMGFDFN